ncbi:addiction module antidote protein, HigA family [Leisingera aquaemixtae]|uniref:Addiction module antidote protein, HigA family n=2 Tax=Leisingera aquaemixtae TaxID=1396826 RepID=A0A0P1HCT7_9RHOB|nr:addiction module antidote protein, HigA family [Leisingera aquaemixtae]
MLTALLTERDWSKRTLAVISGLDETAISKIASNVRKIDAETALIFEDVFGIPAERFLLVQKTYELAVARIDNTPNPERKIRANLIGDLPVSAMIKRGWIDAKSVKDIENVERSLLRFFDANRLEDIETLPHASKKTDVSISATPAQLAWLYRVKTLASEMLVARYSPASVKSAISKIKTLIHSAEELRKVPRILAEAGIRFVIVEALPSTKIDGVCFWLDEKSPVIGMSMRFDRIDNFVFVLRHELEHVLNRDGLETMMLDVDVNSGEATQVTQELVDQETRANEAAAEFCVPKKMMDAFIARKAPVFAKRDIVGFARMLKVHTGLVAGQLQFKTQKYHLGREYLTPVRSIITPNAVTDGWGDVAPTDAY